MDIETGEKLSTLLMWAWLLPLASFVLILFFGKRMGSHGKFAGHLATGAILTSAVLSFTALFGYWLPENPLPERAHHAEAHGEEGHEDTGHGEDEHAEEEHHSAVQPANSVQLVAFAEDHAASDDHGEAAGHGEGHHANNPPPVSYFGDWYTLGQFGSLKLTIGYYIDTLTVAMFCMVSLIATCVHFYAMGYMHDELHDFTDPEVTMSDGEKLKRPGRYYRFFQYLSLFCFSMFGIVIAGNIAMVFVFWELVGICSYFLIGFYIERHSASTAANKAFIVNRVGDFGMLIGLMALWSSLGTFAFGDVKDADGNTVEPGIFSQLRTEENEYHIKPPASVIDEESRVMAQAGKIAEDGEQDNSGQWLLFIAGVGIFCGCVGKSAQFPLHVWLPDAMEGPTPVSALVHSATMVAAGVYLTGRFYPAFTPEALLVIAIVGCITLFVAATIAITATDIKRVLAYSTVSQLGYMMLALGLGWLGGGDVPPDHACVLQRPVVYVLRLGDPRRAHQRYDRDGRLAEEDADHGLHDARRLPGNHWGGDPDPRLDLALVVTTRKMPSSNRRWLYGNLIQRRLVHPVEVDSDCWCIHHRILYVPAVVYDLRR